MKKTIGIFLSDTHMPDHVNLAPVLAYVKDLYAQCQKNGDRFLTILGGDIIDAQGLHGLDSFSAEQIKRAWYERDCALLSTFLGQLKEAAPGADLIYLEGNHEFRYTRIMKRYPEAWGGKFNFHKDVVVQHFPKSKWIPYATYESMYQLGDCLFMHGSAYPKNHAKLYADTYVPLKVVYGHLHHFQAFTNYNAIPKKQPRYAVTAGCLTHLAPEYKGGNPHMWLNGFIDFVSDRGVTTPIAHIIEKGKFYISGKEYK